MLDIDNFKSLNDRLGHASGDSALTHLANVAREVMRPQDSLARYGGEEFVLLLPDTALDHGIEAMTRLIDHSRSFETQIRIIKEMKGLDESGASMMRAA